MDCIAKGRPEPKHGIKTINTADLSPRRHLDSA